MTWWSVVLACAPPGPDGVVPRTCTPAASPCAGGRGPRNLPDRPPPDDWLFAHADWWGAPGDSPLLVQITHFGYTADVIFADDAVELVHGGTLIGEEPIPVTDNAQWALVCEPPETVAWLQIEPDPDASRVLLDVDMTCEGVSDARVRVSVDLVSDPDVRWSVIDEQLH